MRPGALPCPKQRALQPLSGVKIDQKTVKHSPAQKLTDALMGMLAGCKAIYETNARRCARRCPFQEPLDANA